jgi:tetratricopeptide (TPR) repeat protein
MPVAGLESPDRHFALARTLETQGRFAEAAQEWVAGLQIDPRSEVAYLSLADALLELKLFLPASIACRQALIVPPPSAGAYDRLGRAMEGLGDRTQAVAHYSESLKLRPANQAVSHRLAAALRADGRFEAARDVLQSLVDGNGRDSGSRFLLAGVLSAMGLEADAIRHLRKAISHRPRFPEAMNNLALLLRSAGETREAEVLFRKALALRPAYAAAWNNLGNLCVELSRAGEAERCYSKAISIDAGYAEAHTNRALISLLQGCFEQGWLEYEWRWKQPGSSARTLARPEWDGSNIEGKTILLHAEQGAGDTIQFIRYARLLHRQGAQVFVHCQDSLQTLLKGMPELARVFSGPAQAPEFDVHAPLMSLPRMFGTSIDSIPGDTPYLLPPEGPVPQELTSCRGFRVGLVWRGNPSHRNDRNRSVPLELLQDLVKIEGAQFFSLQVGPAAAEEQQLRAGAIVDLSAGLSDYAATARCLGQLDLLITVDTSVAHLAGALGRRVWTLLPACNDWRWLQDREDTPWYPSMRLYRQNSLRNWKPVAERIASDLLQEIKIASPKEN